MSSFFAFLKRMRFINRWSLMRNTEIENIQEHSLEVAMVAHNLAALKNEYFGGNVDINKVAVIEAHDSILAKLKALNMPEVDMFLETYMPALGKSLDELNYYEIK